MVVEIDNLVNIEAKLEGIGDADTLDRELSSKVDHKDVEHNTKKLLTKNNIKESLELAPGGQISQAHRFSDKLWLVINHYR